MALEQVHRFGHRRPRFSTPSRRRRTRAWIAAGLCMGFVALVWAWAFQRGPGEGGADVPLLTADQPTREKPGDPGGMKVSDIDPLQYDSGRTAPRVENILPGPDKPLPQPVPEQRAATVPAAPSDAQTPMAPPAAAPIQTADASVSAGPPLKLVPDIAPPAVKPAAIAAPAPMVKPQGKQPAKPETKSAATPKQPEERAMTVSPGGYRVQLASLKSAADAHKVSDKLKRSYGEVLGAVSLSVMQVNLGDRGTYFRVMAGPMSQNSASQVCDALKQRGAACILARP